MVRAEGSCPRGRGFKSRRILDGCKRIASYYIKEKLKIKVAKWGTPKKKYLKKKCIQADCYSNYSLLFFIFYLLGIKIRKQLTRSHFSVSIAHGIRL